MARSSIELIVDASKAVNPLKRVTAETKKLENATRDANGRLREAKGKFVAIGKSAKTASGGLGTFTGAVKGLAVAAAGIAALKFIFVKTAELEKQARSLTVLTGSANTAKQVIKELKEFGAVTPFESIELIEAAKRLKAFGVDTEKLVDITKRLGDVSGATGADLGGIVTAFGQIQAKGKLQTEELLQLQERGVDLAGVLKKEYNLTGEEFSKALQKGQISAEAAEFALKKLTDTGGQYANGAIAQSTTLSGKFSTLLDGITDLALNIGDALKPAIDFVLTAAINATNQIVRLIQFSNKILGLGTENRIANLNKEITELEGGKRLRGFEARSEKIKRLKNEVAALQGELKPTNAELLKLQDVASASGSLPPLVANTSDPSGSSAGSSTTRTLRERKDLTVEMNALLEKQQQLAHSTDEIAKSRLVKEIEQQKIMEAQMLPLEEQRALRDAEIAHERVIAQVMTEKLNLIAKSNEVRRDGIKSVFEDVFAEGQKIDDQLEGQAEKMRNFYKSIGDSIQSGIVDALTAAVDGTKSLGEVASGVLKDIGKMLLQFGVQLGLQSLTKGTSFANLFKADGGPVSGGSPYIVGERGPELFVPGQSGQVVSNDNMRSAMGRYQRSAGLPGGASQGRATEGAGGGAAVAAPIDVRFKVERINNVDYVTAAEFQQGMQQAAKQGAQRGEQQAIKRLQMSSSTRRRVGL